MAELFWSGGRDLLTWSVATEITGTAKQSGWTWYATGPGAGIQLRRGAQAGRLLIACDHIRADNKSFGSHVIYSDDHGANWQIGAIAVTTATVRLFGYDATRRRAHGAVV